jgi:hypothetical protein
MEWVYLLAMEGWKDFGKDSWMFHPHSYKKERHSTPELASHTMGLFKRYFFFSNEMGT